LVITCNCLQNIQHEIRTFFIIEGATMKKSLTFFGLILFATIISGCIISVTPKGDQALCPGESLKFSVVDMAQNPKVYKWTLDGVQILGATGNSYTYTPTASEVGMHELKVQILWDSRSWNIEVKNCATWTVDPLALDFGYIQTDKTILVQNTGPVPLTLSADLSGTEEFVTGVDFMAPEDGNAVLGGVTTSPAPIEPGVSQEVTVTVSRQGLSTGLYSTSFVLKSDKGNSVTIPVTMNVGIAKILFSVDTSGSMIDNDPQDKRVSAVKETINKFYDNENVSFGIIDFDDRAKILTGFTRDRTLLGNYANVLGDDNGWTNYLGSGSYTPGALDSVDQLIDENETGTHFVVIFLSDGEPTKGNVGHDPIVEKVAAIASPGNVKLYTIYLNGHPSSVAQLLLNDMAVAGDTAQTHVYTDPDSLSFIDLDF
jgi:hypothetical protein